MPAPPPDYPAAWEVEDGVAPPPDAKLKRLFGKMGCASTAIMIAEALAIPFLENSLAAGSWGRMLTTGVLVGTYALMCTGYSGWVFTHCWVGFRHKAIWVPGESSGDEDYSGRAAQAWALAGMLMALGLLVASLLPIYFLFYPS